jgi:hypothetical protein
LYGAGLRPAALINNCLGFVVALSGFRIENLGFLIRDNELLITNYKLPITNYNAKRVEQSGLLLSLVYRKVT